MSKTYVFELAKQSGAGKTFAGLTGFTHDAEVESDHVSVNLLITKEELGQLLQHLVQALIDGDFRHGKRYIGILCREVHRELAEKEGCYE